MFGKRKRLEKKMEEMFDAKIEQKLSELQSKLTSSDNPEEIIKQEKERLNEKKPVLEQEIKNSYTASQLRGFKIVGVLLLLVIGYNIYTQTKILSSGNTENDEAQEILDKLQNIEEEKELSDEELWNSIYNDSAKADFLIHQKLANGEPLTKEDSAKLELFEDCDCPNVY